MTDQAQDDAVVINDIDVLTIIIRMAYEDGAANARAKLLELIGDVAVTVDAAAVRTHLAPASHLAVVSHDVGSTPASSTGVPSRLRRGL